MKLLIKQAKIICSNSNLHGEIKDIFIEDGVITNISDYLDVQADNVISSENLHVSIGWMDVFAQFSDPGYEFRETLESGVAAAAAGGARKHCSNTRTALFSLRLFKCSSAHSISNSRQ